MIFLDHFNIIIQFILQFFIFYLTLIYIYKDSYICLKLDHTRTNHSLPSKNNPIQYSRMISFTKNSSQLRPTFNQLTVVLILNKHLLKKVNHLPHQVKPNSGSILKIQDQSILRFFLNLSP
jgi:hypothetical protein